MRPATSTADSLTPYAGPPVSSTSLNKRDCSGLKTTLHKARGDMEHGGLRSFARARCRDYPVTVRRTMTAAGVSFRCRELWWVWFQTNGVMESGQFWAPLQSAGGPNREWRPLGDANQLLCKWNQEPTPACHRFSSRWLRCLLFPSSARQHKR